MSLPPAPVERRRPVQDWARRQAARLAWRRTRAEAARLDDAPRLSVRWPWRREAADGRRHQTLRAFVQINVMPRP
jgi:hypothetical protein